MAERESKLLDEVLEANRAFQSGEPVPRPTSLGEQCLLVFTCMDPRLTALLPRAMGVAPEEMFQVRNGGANLREGDAIRSIAATLMLMRASEVFVVGHTDCAMRKATASSFLDGMRRRGVDRSVIQGDVRDWFGGIASERSNALEAAREVRACPVIPPGTPVHALLVDTATGKIEVLERGDRAASVPRLGSTPSSPPRSEPRPSVPLPAESPLDTAPSGPISLFDSLRRPPTPPVVQPQEEPVELASRPAPRPPPPPPRSPRPAQREAAGMGPPSPPPAPKPPPPPPEPPPPAPKPPPPPTEPPPPPPPPLKTRGTRRKPSRESSPFERAEDVLKKLMRKRGK
ncbi:MAG: beta-class carbonic anhydrase [Planctomycetota bacterium]|jgi:carbonic anhydrase